MIKNEHQYQITQAWVQRFTDTLTSLDADTQEGVSLPPLLRQAERDAAASQIETLQRELWNYQAICRSRPAVPIG